MGTIRKRGDYQFQAQVRRTGYPAQSKTFDSRKDAEKWVRMIEREMDTGTFIPRGESERTTIQMLADRYLADRVENKMRGERQEVQRVNAIVAKFGSYNLSAVSPAMVAAWRDELTKKPLAPQTVQHYIAVLGRLYKAAAVDFGIPLPLGNPAENIRKPVVRNERDRGLDADEEKRLMEALDLSRGEHLKSIVRLALETAMRRGEIIGLTWENIDLIKQTAFLPTTKNGDSRTVPLSTRAVAVLKSLPRNIAGGRVFKTSETAVTEGFQRAAKRAKLEDLRFHDLRHVAVSRLAKLLQMHELAKVAGHRSPRSVMRYYKQDDADLVRKLG
jgi:integrase